MGREAKMRLTNHPEAREQAAISLLIPDVAAAVHREEKSAQQHAAREHGLSTQDDAGVAQGPANFAKATVDQVGGHVMEGADGSDTYHFGIGSGADEIREWLTNANLGEFDRIVFGAGIALEDLNFARDGNDLVVTIDGAGDSLTVAGQFNNSAFYTWNDVEEFELADGTILTKLQVQQRLLEAARTSGDDHIVGFVSDDLLDGGAGNDLLEGGDEADIYVFGLGYGQDEIRESVTEAILSEQDQLRFGPGIVLEDLSFARDGNDLVTYDSMDDKIMGGSGFDVLDATKSADLIQLNDAKWHDGGADFFASFERVNLNLGNDYFLGSSAAAGLLGLRK